jgi:hypothetical protein
VTYEITEHYCTTEGNPPPFTVDEAELLRILAEEMAESYREELEALGRAPAAREVLALGDVRGDARIFDVTRQGCLPSSLIVREAGAA